jgi:guanine deaminase
LYILIFSEFLSQSAMAPTLEKTIYKGPFVHSKSLQELDICQKGAIGVDEKGLIAFVERDDVEGVSKKEGWENAKVVEVKDHGFFFPGFIGGFTLQASTLHKVTTCPTASFP